MIDHETLITVCWTVVLLCALQTGGMYLTVRLFLYGPIWAKKREKEHTYEPVRGDFGR